MLPRTADLKELDQTTWPNHRLSRLVEAGGVRWYVQQSGRGPSMLLVHGAGASTHSWRDVLPILAGDYSVLAADLPGHGFTEGVSAAQSSIGGMGTLMSALLQKLGVSPAYVVGHSAGAAVLCRMSLDGAIDPRVIVSINGAFFAPRGTVGGLYSTVARMLAARPWVSRIIAWRARDPANVARLLAGTGSTLDVAGIELYRRLASNPRHLSGVLGMMANWNLASLERDLPRLRSPLALLAAANDLTVPPYQALRVRDVVPSAVVYPIPGLGHLAHEEQPEVLSRQISIICRAAG